MSFSIKKISLFLLLFCCLLVTATATIPYLINIGTIQNELTTYCQENFAVTVSVDKANFQWFPSPHIDLTNAQITHDNYEATIPKVSLFFTPMALWDPSKAIGYIKLTDPTGRLKNSSPLFTSSKTKFKIPSGKILITNGTLILPGSNSQQITSKALNISNLNVTISSIFNKIKFEATARSSFSDEISIIGKYSPLVTNATIKCQNLILNNLLEINVAGLQIADNKPLSFSLNLDQNNNEVNLDYYGNLPNINLQRLNKTSQINLGNSSFKITLRPDFFNLNIVIFSPIY